MIKAIISDADGTLVNTLHLIRHGQYQTAVRYLTKQQVPRSDIPPYEIYKSYIDKSVGGPTRETLEKTIRLLFADIKDHHLQNIDFDELDRSLTPIQDEIAPLYVHPFHGLTELFSWAGSEQIGIGIFTSGDKRMIVRNFGISLPVLGYEALYLKDDIPSQERLDAFIQRAQAIYGLKSMAVVTHEEIKNTKPDPEGIFMLVKKLDVSIDEVLVVGDHTVDMQAAQAAGARAVGVSHGFSSAADLKEAGAMHIVHDLTSIIDYIHEHNAQEAP